MKIENVRVYGLEESIIASGYPMKTKLYSEDEFTDECNALAYAWDIGTEDFNEESKIKYEKDIKRAINLGSVESGTAHDNYLKGIIVQYDLTAPEYFWRQFDRYHFHDYVSSQSKMHCILKFDIKNMCNKYVDDRVIDIVNEKIKEYNNTVMSKFITQEECQRERSKKFQEIISNVPMGLELTARITDNYLQLKSKYKQRRYHKLEEWQYYCDWIRILPMFTKIVLKEE
jgi:hypothetical protein